VLLDRLLERAERREPIVSREALPLQLLEQLLDAPVSSIACGISADVSEW
jgi:hypothetical protein